jgi:hypothetical protein
MKYTETRSYKPSLDIPDKDHETRNNMKQISRNEQ